MKLPSIQHLYNNLTAVIKRFPIQLAFIVIATVCWIYHIKIESYSVENQNVKSLLVKAILTCNLGLTLTLALDLLSEKKAFDIRKKWLMRIGAILACLALFFFLNPDEFIADRIRIFLLAFAFHLFVAFSPFMEKGNINGFWQFNKVLFLRFLAAALYSGVLFAGLAVALLAVNGLFNVEINWKTYLTVFAIIAAGFSPIFFLAGVPKDFNFLENDASYPKGLKIFTQFVLIPLMTIYLAILLFYEIKIIAIWSLPKGLVSSLIIGYAVFGILSLLLIYPMKDKEGNSWIKLFSRFFYLMLIPLIILLLLAVWKRVAPYGITESRYILVVIALWLTGITLYFLISKKQNIKLIPISLSILTLFTVYGPQSASGISRYSQVARLSKIFNSKYKQELQEKTSIIRYLVSRHGLHTLQQFTSKDLNRVESLINKKNVRQYVKEEARVDSAFLIFEVNDEYRYNSGVQYTFINADDPFLNIKGFDYLLQINSYETAQKKFNGINIKIDPVHNNKYLIINLGDTSKMTIDVGEIFDTYTALADKNQLRQTPSDAYFIPKSKLTFSKLFNGYQFTYVIKNLNGNTGNPSSKYRYLSQDGYLLIKKIQVNP